MVERNKIIERFAKPFYGKVPGIPDYVVRQQFAECAEALSRTGAVKVKTLEWHARPGVDGTFDAYTEIGHFIVTITDDERGMWFLVGITQSNYCEPDMGIVKAAAQADYERRIISALEPAAPEEWHPDDIAVDRFAATMKAKLKWEREERGRSGWQEMSDEELSRLLFEHLPKGDPVDVANLCMMLSLNGQRIVAAPECQQEAVAWFIEWRFKPSSPDVKRPGGGSKVLWGDTSTEAAATEVSRLRGIETVDWVRCSPLYTRPAEQAVTEALSRIRDYADKPHADRYVIRNMAEDALKAAMEAGG